MRTCIAEAIGTAVSGGLDLLWLYGAGPTLGALLAVAGCRCVRSPECCRALPDST